MDAPTKDEILEVQRAVEELLFEEIGKTFRKMPPLLMQLLLRANRALLDAAIHQMPPPVAL